MGGEPEWRRCCCVRVVRVVCCARYNQRPPVRAAFSPAAQVQNKHIGRTWTMTNWLGRSCIPLRALPKASVLLTLPQSSASDQTPAPLSPLVAVATTARDRRRPPRARARVTWGVPVRVPAIAKSRVGVALGGLPIAGPGQRDKLSPGPRAYVRGRSPSLWRF